MTDLPNGPSNLERFTTKPEGIVGCFRVTREEDHTSAEEKAARRAATQALEKAERPEILDDARDCTVFQRSDDGRLDLNYK